MLFGKIEIHQNRDRSDKDQDRIDIVKRKHRTSHLNQNAGMHGIDNAHPDNTHRKDDRVSGKPAQVLTESENI